MKISISLGFICLINEKSLLKIDNFIMDYLNTTIINQLSFWTIFSSNTSINNMGIRLFLLQNVELFNINISNITLIDIINTDDNPSIFSFKNIKISFVNSYFLDPIIKSFHSNVEIVFQNMLIENCNFGNFAL